MRPIKNLVDCSHHSVKLIILSGSLGIWSISSFSLASIRDQVSEGMSEPVRWWNINMVAWNAELFHGPDSNGLGIRGATCELGKKRAWASLPREPCILPSAEWVTHKCGMR
jgi:hypothetical protein